MGGVIKRWVCMEWGVGVGGLGGVGSAGKVQCIPVSKPAHI